jgi:O-acetylhomoserine/O-acetylserine sulfhydrylase-like pyridoxal-dependent enzyme
MNGFTSRILHTKDKRRDVNGTQLILLSIGVEEVEDIIADIDQALERC